MFKTIRYFFIIGILMSLSVGGGYLVFLVFTKYGAVLGSLTLIPFISSTGIPIHFLCEETL